MKCIKLLTIFIIICCISSIIYSEEASKEQNRPLKVAIFGRNNTGDKKYDKYVTQLKSELTNSLSGEFTIIDKDDVISTFEKVKKNEKIFTNMDIFSFILTLSQLNKEEYNLDNEKTIEQKSSALRISQMLGADYFLVADIEDIVINNIKDEVYGNKINDLVLTTDVAVKIVDGYRGGSIAGKSVRTFKRLHGDEKTFYTNADVTQNLPLLIKQAGKDIAKYFLENVQKIKNFEVDVPRSVKFIVKCNTDNVVVELDGVVIGSAPGEFFVPPGLHRIRLTKDGFRSFERDINIFDNFQLYASLEMTAEGLEKYEKMKDVQMQEKEREAAIRREDKKAEAEAYSIKKKADAEYKWGPKGKKKEDW